LAKEKDPQVISRNLRILIPILGFAPHGGYRVLSELANQWIKLGHECAFLVPSSSPDAYFPTKAEVIRFDKRGNIPNGMTKGQQTGFDNILSLWAGLNAIGSEYDVLLANHSLTAWPVRFANAGKAKKLYYIQAYEPLYYSVLKSPLKKMLAYGSYKIGLQMISNSSVYPIPPQLINSIIPPGVDLDIFREKTPVEKTSDDRIINIGTIGRAEPYKGTSTVIKAYRKLRVEGAHIFLKVALGNVEQGDDLSIHPINNDHELAAFYREIDILVVACQGQRGAPHYPVIEAMASGTPVVHTGYFPGTKDNSWEATEASRDAVSAAISQLIETPPEEVKRRTRKARQLIESRLSWPAVAKQFISEFEK